MLTKTIISLPHTDKAIQDNVNFFIQFGWRLLSVEIIGETLKYTIGWPRKREFPVYPIQIKQNQV